MRHVWIVEVRNPRDDYPVWWPVLTVDATRKEARVAAKIWGLYGNQTRVRKYTPETMLEAYVRRGEL